MSKKLLLSVFAILALVLLFSACNANKEQDERSPEAVYTEAAQTVAAELTKMASEDETLPSATLTPEADSTATPDQQVATATVEEEVDYTPTQDSEPTQAGNCTLKADFVADITIPDDTALTPGEAFTKTWQIINSGSCTWGDGYTIFFVSGTDMGAGANLSLTNGIEVPQGTLINVSVELVAPTEAGEYRADFKFKDASGTFFGTGAGGNGTIYLEIIVAEPTPEPSNTPEPTQTATATVTPTPTTELSTP